MPDETRKKPWLIEAMPIKDGDDRRGTFRHDMDKVLGRAMTRYLGSMLEWVFPNIDLIVTEGVVTITVTTKTTHTCPLTIINGDVTINGNLRVNGNIHATGDITAGSVSLRKHIHPGCSGGTTGSPIGG